MNRESKLLQLAFTELPEYVETEGVNTLEQLIDLIVTWLSYKPQKPVFLPFLVKYGAFLPEYIEKNYPDVYRYVEDEKPAEDILNYVKDKGATTVNEQDNTQTTPVLCERGVIKRLSEQIKALRKDKENLIFGLTAKAHNPVKCEEARQELNDFGCDVIYFETRTGVDTERVVTGALFKELKAGDTLVITQATNLAKSNTAFFKTILCLIENKIKLISLKEAWLTMTTEADFERLKVFMEGMQGFEQDVVVEHKNNAVKKAQAEGTRFGRSLKANADVERAIEMYKTHKDVYTVSKIAEINNISRTTLWRRLRDMNLLEK